MTEDRSQQTVSLESFIVGEPVFSTSDKVNEVVSVYQQQLIRLVRRKIGGDHHQAEDLVQAMFLRLLSNSFVFRGRAQLGAYLRQTAEGVASDFLRLQATKNMMNTRSIHHEDGVEGISDHVARKPDHGEEELEPFEARIQGLTERERLLARWRFVEGRTVPEIAELLGCSVGTVSSRLSRMTNKLRGESP